MVSEGDHRTKVAARLIRRRTRVGLYPVGDGSQTRAFRSVKYQHPLGKGAWSRGCGEIEPWEQDTMRPLFGAMSTLVTVLSWPFNTSASLKAFPALLYSSTDESRATARVAWSAENEWSAMGLWNKWWTSGAAMFAVVGAIGVALYYRLEREVVIWNFRAESGGDDGDA